MIVSKKKWAVRASSLTALVASATLAVTGVAFADNLMNDVDVAVGNDTITAGGSTTIGYKINATGVGNDGQAGCNASDGTAATLTLSVPANVAANTTSLTFTACNAFQYVTFSSSVAGSYGIGAAVSDSGVGTYDNKADWTLTVNAAAWTNTKPSVVVTGVSDGASYEIGAVPAAGCDITDAQDGLSSTAAGISGALSHGLGSQTATCDATDSGGLKADTATATYTIVDTGDPTISHSLTPSGGPNGFGWYKQDVTVTFTCADLGGSGIQSCVGDTTLLEGAGQSVTGTATDWAGNTDQDIVSGINIDKTAPSVALVGGPGASYYYGSDPAAPTCEASDLLSGLDGTCAVTGGGTSVGHHTWTATATDKAGNTAKKELNYQVLAWEKKGFYSPVDMGGVWNTVKGGSTVPLKFELFAASELTNISAVKSFTQRTVSCPTSAFVDDIELVTTGGTSLRYDETAGQFVQNWQTPKKPGTCYQAIMTAQDGSTISANFMLK